MKPREQAVEGDEAGFAGEDAIELGFQNSLALRGRRVTVGLELAVELPDGGAHGGLGGAILIREGVEFVNRALGMNLIQSSELWIIESVFSPAARPWPSPCAQTSDPRRWAKNVLD
jgi:hypothetical protein